MSGKSPRTVGGIVREYFRRVGAVMSDRTELAVCGVTDLGRERTSNEDGLLVADALNGAPIACLPEIKIDLSGTAVLLAVADGMGGQDGGEIASALTLAAVRAALPQELAQHPPGDALRLAIEHANAVVAQEATTAGKPGMGATIVAAVVQNGRAVIGSVGDSRIYVLRRDQLVQVTRDQSFLQSLIDNGSIAPEQVASFPLRNVILQAVGCVERLEVPILCVDLRRDDVLLLCSDGLTTEVADAAIRDVLSKQSLDVACTELVAAANAHGGNDNITVILAACGDGFIEAGANEAVAAVPYANGWGSE